jgi:hypothetical protein
VSAEEIMKQLDMLIAHPVVHGAILCARCGVYNTSATAMDRFAAGKSWHDEKCAVLVGMRMLKAEVEAAEERGRRGGLNAAASLCIHRGAKWRPESVQRAVWDIASEAILELL